VADPTKSATAAVTIQPQVAVTLSPTAAAVILGATQQFSVTVSGTSNTAITWSVTGPGSISQTGLYQAPATLQTPATVTVRATSQADPSKNASATITLPAIVVTVSPASAVLQPGNARQFNAAVTNATNTAVSWSAPDGGSVNATGRYTAPNIGGDYRVIATSNADPTKRFIADVTVETEPDPKLQAEKHPPQAKETPLQAEKTTDGLTGGPPDTSPGAPTRRGRRSAQPAEGRVRRGGQRAFIQKTERQEES
jgi:hypothetical protein